MADVLVIGSSNTDMVVRVGDLPLPGQTVMGSDFQVFAGGKGANQAVAARRAGSKVRFIAAVGDDDFGRASLAGFEREGILTDTVQVLKGTPSGVAMIFVSDQGENCIGVAPGANHGLREKHLEQQQSAFFACSHVLLQLESPMATVEHAVALGKAHGKKVILNPAPAAPLSPMILEGLYCITPNETEAEALTGIPARSIEGAQQAAQALLAMGALNVIVTLGSSGVLMAGAEGSGLLPAEQVEVIDTTGAGDTFNGVLAALLAEGRPLYDAAALAVRAATLSVQKPGATDSIPWREQFMD